jgi:hypothetical protein
VQPGKAGIDPAPFGRHQHVDDVQVRLAPDAVVQQGDRAGDEAARPGVEQGGHLFLEQSGRSACAQVDAGQQHLPRATPADAVLRDRVGHADGEQLPAADHAELLVQEFVQAV